MKLSRQILKSHPLLSLIPSFARRRLMKDSTMLEFAKGTVIFNEGDAPEAIYLIASGRCESIRSSGGRGEVDQIFGPGDLLGEKEFLHQEPYRSTVRVITDSVVVRIEGEQLRAIFSEKPQIAGRFTHSVASTIRSLREGGGAGRRLRSIACISSMSSHLAESVLVTSLADAVPLAAGQRVLVVHFCAAADCGLSLDDWDDVESPASGRFFFKDQLKHRTPHIAEITIQIRGHPEDPSHIAPMLGHFGAHFDYVIVHLEDGVPAPVCIECMIQADTAYVFADADAHGTHTLLHLIKELHDQNRAGSETLKAILLANGDREAFGDAADSLRKSGFVNFSLMHGYPARTATSAAGRDFVLQVRRMAREIARCRIGLALSSGGAKGLAHVGVIQVLEENGIEIDLVAGSSMGAYVGATWCRGNSGPELERIAREIEGRWGLMRLFEPSFPPRKGFLKSGRVIARLERSIGDVRFSELAIPLRIIATYLDTLERAVFSTGNVVDAVSASIAIPGICVPVILDGNTLIDGGIADPLPVDVLREAGIERVIAVNTIPTPERLRYCNLLEMERPPPPRPFLDFLNAHLNYFARGNVLDTMMRSIHGVQTQIAEMACKDADVVLRPLACDARWHDFANPGKYIALGRKVTEEQIDEIKLLVTEKIDEPEPSLALTA